MHRLLELGSGEGFVGEEVTNVLIGAVVRLPVLIFDDETLVAPQQILPLPVELGLSKSEPRDTLHFHQECVQTLFNPVFLDSSTEIRFIFFGCDEWSTVCTRSKKRRVGLLGDLGQA